MTKATPGSRRGNAEASKIRNALPLSVRDDKILASRLPYAVRHASRHGLVELGVETAQTVDAPNGVQANRVGALPSLSLPAHCSLAGSPTTTKGAHTRGCVPRPWWRR